MKSLFITSLLIVLTFADSKIENTFHGFYNKPRNINFEPVVPKPRVIKGKVALSSFTRMIVANKISKTSPAVASSDPLLKKSTIDFSKHMLLVMFNGEPMKDNPKVLNIKTSKEMVVSYELSNKLTIASYPNDVAKYTAVVVEKFAGNVRFKLEKKSSQSLKPNLFRKKSDLQYIVTKPCSYLEHPPQAAIANPEIAIQIGTTFDMVNDTGSYVKVKFYNGKHGYLPNNSGCWHKLVSVYGKVVKLFQSGKESIDLSKEKIPFMLDTTAEANSPAKLGYLFHESAKNMLDKIEKIAGNNAKIRGVIEKEDAVLGVIRIYEIWRMKNTRNAVE
ncbi:hypothetical protein [Candidatus Uabimicrobium sp. HlEnr_7]|uniref:hypothetical protein n=1 Tax=Candidatus Uabimicrobium helgolandensis TaxID=3095367 RepID=UPI003557ABB9